MYTQVMLILILIDVQYLQNIVFSFEKGSNSQNYSSSGSHQPIKKSPLAKGRSTQLLRDVTKIAVVRNLV